MPNETGLVHVYCGDGKGKTTAALGLGLRACGRGLRVLLVRFLKDADSGELAALARLPGFRTLDCPARLPFFRSMGEAEKADYAAFAAELWESAARTAGEGGCDLLILDEACAAAKYGLLSEAQVADFLARKPAGLEVVLTGREPPASWLALADYVSRVACEKHPYRRGVPARPGIEY